MKKCIDDMEHRILAALQDGLPLSRTPYSDLARQIGVPTDTLLTVLDNWRRDGTLRRLGAIVNHFQVGLSGGAMVVWKVPPERRAEVGAIFAGFAEVSHAYERQTPPQWPYSLYTMVHGTTQDMVRDAIRRMSEAAAMSEYVVLSTLKELKKTAPKYTA